MRRNSRKREPKSLSDKIILYCGIGVAILSIVVIGLLLYSRNLSEDVRNGTMSLEDMASILEENETEENSNTTESASTEIGKTVEESEKEKEEENKNATQNNTSNSASSKTKNVNVNSSSTPTTNANQNKNSQNTNTTENKTVQTNTEEVKQELSFIKPVEGDVVREYAKDNLLYSETLKEWVTHTGIDIKAEKTTVVKAAEKGTVKTIKNDPRYGLTIVIDHGDGMQTVYSNLLTSEFVVEGENVEKGQTIGTVGNTAVFEIADEPHLHFEILKNSIAEDPSIYIK